MMTRTTRMHLPETVSLHRTYAVPAERLFTAWTNPELLTQWWGPSGSQLDSVEIDLREGGSYRFGIIDPNGEVYFVQGVYKIIKPPYKLAFTWRWEKPEMDIGDSLVTIVFTAQNGETEMVLTHARLPNEMARQAHRKGWVDILENLASFLNG